MKKMRVFMFLVLSLLLTNCNKEEKKVEENNVEKTEVVATNNENKEEDINIKFSDETYKILEVFTQNKEETIKRLKGLTKEKANKLLDKYMEENQELLWKIDENENYFKDFQENDYEKKFKEVNKFFNKYGLIMQESPGSTGVVAPSSFYYNIFKDYVSDEYRDYLKLTSKYNDVDVVFMPSNLTIQETGERIVAFGNFLDKYPNTKFKDTASVYANYIKEYIRYSLPYKDGSPEDYYNVSEENKKEYEKFIDKYPDSITAHCLEYLLENYKNKDWTSIDETIDEIMKKEMEERYNITEIFGL